MNNKDYKDLLKKQFNENKDDIKLLEENFDQNISPRLKIRNKKIKSNPFSFILRYRIALSFVLVFAFLITLSIMIGNSFTNQENPDDNPNNDDIDQLFSSDNLNYVLYAAAKKSLDKGPTIKTLSYSLTEVEESFPRIEYPFDHVRITNPFRFEIEIPENSGTLIEELVGFGKLEVIICSVELLTVNGDDFVNYYPNEEYILFKGPQGIYGCLTNGGLYDPDENVHIYEFSTHKFIEGDNIVKENKLESIKIHVTLVRDIPTELSFENWPNAFYYEGTYLPVKDSYKKVVTSDVYKIADFEEPSIKFIEVILENTFVQFDGLKDKNYGKIKDIEGLNLDYFNIDESTKIILEDNLEGDFEDLSPGQILNISYRDYYEGYNPNFVVVEEVYVVGKEIVFEEIIKSIFIDENGQHIETLFGSTIFDIIVDDSTLIRKNGTIIDYDDLRPSDILSISGKEYIAGFKEKNIYIDSINVIGTYQEREVTIKTITVEEEINIYNITPFDGIDKMRINDSTIIHKYDGTIGNETDLQINQKIRVFYREYYESNYSYVIVSEIYIIE